ncbi:MULTISPECIES: sensor histidine kinase [Emticicia]|uniref:sensor histidine kinase n=1 Tax=Emticicia TaxID=312278 RepID=UPI0020A0BB34|nr:MULTISPECIES: histidine kinase [Emticicia]UTA67244.1 histidine kinase [Emticicia sp. 21SJ11W-3]
MFKKYTYSAFFILLLSISTHAQISIRQVLINGQVYPYKPGSGISISAPDENLVIELNPVKGNSIRYFYRIRPMSESWFWSNYPSVHYQNLPGGNYHLQIKAVDNKQRVVAAAQVSINKNQAFWQKWWFWPSIVIYILLIFGAGFYLFFIYDLRQKLKLQHIRNQIASDLHDEVGSNLNSIAIFIELLRKKVIKQNPDLLPILDKITDNSEETVLLMRDTVWAINPENDSTEKLFERMRSFGVEMLTARGITFNFELLIDGKRDIFPMEQRRNIYLIYKEAINNISKHSQATHASCQVTRGQGMVKIQVSDNGKGFNVNEIFEGNGLKNFKHRSQEYDLNVSVQSSAQTGTEVLIEITI